MTEHRALQLGEQLKREISDIIRNEMKDPRIGFVSIVDVEVSKDLRHAKVFFSVLGDENEKEATLAGLENATGFVRTTLGKRLRLRHIPEIDFRLDDSIERGARIAEILRELGVEGDEKNE